MRRSMFSSFLGYKRNGKRKMEDPPMHNDEGVRADLPLAERLHPDEAAYIANAIIESMRESVVVPTDVGTSAQVQATSATAGGTSSSTTPRARKSFKDVVSPSAGDSQTTSVMASGSPLHDDSMRFQVSALPAKCQVNNPALHDPLVDGYNDLPALKTGSLRSWSRNATGSTNMERLILFSQWSKQCPNLDFYAARDAIRFTHYEHFINPSRVSPLEVNVLYTSYDRKRSVLQYNYRTAICLSPILSVESHLIEPSQSGLKNKYISGHFHQQEWQRLQGFTCMVFDRPSLVAQIYNDTISFMTSGPLKAERDSYFHSKTPRNPNILTSTPGSSSDKAASSKPFRNELSYTDDVPIYDAREVQFNFTTDLEKLDSVLPKYDDEVPPGSFVIVGYTMTHYDKDGRSNLSTNVMFAILLATE